MDLPFLDANWEALNRMGFAGQFRLAQGLAAFALLCLVAFLVWGYLTNSNADRTYEQLRRTEIAGEGKTRELWNSTVDELRQQRFDENGKSGDLRLFSRTAEPLNPSIDFPRVEIVIVKNHYPVAIADVLLVQASASWEIGSYERLELGDSAHLTLDSIFESNAYACAFDNLKEPRIDIVFVGLESYPAADRPNGIDLDRQRANALGIACIERYKGKWPHDVDFHGIELGRALDESIAKTSTERAQRRAVIVTLSTRLPNYQALDTADIIALVIKSTEVDHTKLSRYSEVDSVADQIRNHNIDFAGVATRVPTYRGLNPPPGLAAPNGDPAATEGQMKAPSRPSGARPPG